MKRGKDGEKIMGPMFPRLHVTDAAEKGGPRAPPRNKMALYEQLSIPSQRFNPALLPVKPNANYSVPPSSSDQVSSADRRNFFHLHPPLCKPTFLPKNFSSLEFGRPNSLAELWQLDKSDDEDITVPVFSQLQEGLEKNQNSKNNKDLTSVIPNCSHRHSMRIQTKNIGPEKNLAEVENVDGESKEADKCSQGSGNSEFAREIEVANASEPRRDSPSGNTEGSDDMSEASILDSISVMDISPDDVVGIIGQKHFWKARRAIVNQQRVFAVQVFELHRLIKVQKLIASSPHLLLEDTSTALSKPSSKSSLETKLIVESNNKSLPPATRHTDEPEKPAHPVECSAENAVGRAPITINKSAPPTPPTISNSGPWHPTQHQSPGQQQWLIPVMSAIEGLVYKPYPGPGFSGTSFCGPYSSSPMMMSNFMNPAYGVPAHQGTGFIPGIPNAGHSYFPTYGMPVMSAGVAGTGSGSISAAEQVNCPSEPNPGTQTVHNQGQEPNHLRLQSSCNNDSVSVPRTAPAASRIQMSKVSDLQGSTGSSPPCDRAERTQTCASQNPSSSNERLGTEPGGSKELTNVHSNRKDVLPLFPMAPAMADAERLAGVIRAVPHNARSAAASAARIFRSIQEERKHHDSN